MEDDKVMPSNIHSEPSKISVNLKNGYTIHPITGDSIKPIINSLGDTVITGKRYSIVLNEIDCDSFLPPYVVTPVIKSNLYSELTGVLKRPAISVSIKDKKIHFVSFPDVKEDDSVHVLVNGINKKIRTGVRLPVRGSIKQLNEPKSVLTAKFRTKDNATRDIQYVDVDQGLHSSFIWSVLIDKKGKLWLGSKSAGVCNIDGAYQKIYGINEGLSNNVVLDMLEDKDGNIWFATMYGGVSKFDGHVFTHFTEKEGMLSNYVTSLAEDFDGNIWFGTYNGLTRYDGTSFFHLSTNEGLCNNRIESLLINIEGSLWAGSDGCINIVKDDSVGYLVDICGKSMKTVASLCNDLQGNTWVGTYNGVFKFTSDSIHLYTEEEGISLNAVMSITCDNNGAIWVGTDGGGINVFKDNKISYINKDNGLISNRISRIVHDAVGIVYVGTSGGGLVKINNTRFRHFISDEFLDFTNVRSFYEDDASNIWMGTYGSGIYKYDGISFTRIYFGENVVLNYIENITEDKNGNLWFATFGGGVLRYDGKSFNLFDKSNGFNNLFVRSMISDKSGKMWFGTYGGIIVYDGKKLRYITENEGLSHNTVWSIHEDIDGKIWVGSFGGGMSVIEDDEIMHYTRKEGLISNDIFTAKPDSNGGVWMGTYGGGAVYFKNDFFYNYGVDQGVDNNSIRTVVSDHNGKIYLASDNGLFVLDKNKSGDGYYVSKFTKEDGLIGTDFLQNSAFIDSQNGIWWGTGKGLTFMKPENSNYIAAKPELKSLTINDKRIDYRQPHDSILESVHYLGVSAFNNYPLNLELNNNYNHLTFFFSAIDKTSQHKLRYSYRLLGLNSNWSGPTSETKADYQNLPFGEYKLQVRATCEDGHWSDVMEYEFIIYPPWWHTWWARVVYILFTFILIFALIKWRTSSLKKRQKELEFEIHQATLEIRNQKQSVEKQKELIEEKHKEITDSINYAERIQRSFLATRQILDENLRDYFVFFRPKDIVSGDFYWAAQLKNGNFAFSVADSTGHGVPGAIMSILNISSLEKSIENQTEPHKILFETRKIIINRLKNDGSVEGGKDGMDCSLLVLNQDKSELTFASANNPVIIIRDKEILEYRGDKLPVGKHDKDQDSFTLHTLSLKKNDMIYALTDGFPDQFGGPKGKKFMIKSLKELFLTIAHLPVKEQEQQIAREFENWKGTHEQVDDVCVIGVRL
jgi:ligand-binding sensor domain-containing protein/serine phosphatase RsbU (regulator of sigma subunit)